MSQPEKKRKTGADDEPLHTTASATLAILHAQNSELNAANRELAVQIDGLEAVHARMRDALAAAAEKTKLQKENKRLQEKVVRLQEARNQLQAELSKAVDPATTETVVVEDEKEDEEQSETSLEKHERRIQTLLKRLGYDEPTTAAVVVENAKDKEKDEWPASVQPTPPVRPAPPVVRERSVLRCNNCGTSIAGPTQSSNWDGRTGTHKITMVNSCGRCEQGSLKMF